MDGWMDRWIDGWLRGEWGDIVCANLVLKFSHAGGEVRTRGGMPREG